MFSQESIEAAAQKTVTTASKTICNMRRMEDGEVRGPQAGSGLLFKIAFF